MKERTRIEPYVEDLDDYYVTIRNDNENDNNRPLLITGLALMAICCGIALFILFFIARNELVNAFSGFGSSGFDIKIQIMAIASLSLFGGIALWRGNVLGWFLVSALLIYGVATSLEIWQIAMNNNVPLSVYSSMSVSPYTDATVRLALFLIFLIYLLSGNVMRFFNHGYASALFLILLAGGLVLLAPNLNGYLLEAQDLLKKMM